MVRTQIQLTEEQSQRLKAVAARTGLSMSELVRRGVDAITAQMLETTPDELRRRALKVAGSFRSDLTDVAESHDKYLGGAFS